VAWTLLRPTLVWGDGRDRNLSRLAAAARRYGCIVLPSDARGGRQPVHAAEVAAALWSALARQQSVGHRLDLPGGEIVPYDEMARRVAAAVAPPGRIWRLPAAPLRLAAGVAVRLRRVDAALPAMLARMREDLVFDAAPARALLQWTPGPFAPRAEDFPDGTGWCNATR
jgi:nucleoside-diphosphate-sugar epimerase